MTIRKTNTEGVLDGVELLANPGRGKPEFLGRIIYIMLCCDSQECD
jgi:hypothetical protein